MIGRDASFAMCPQEEVSVLALHFPLCRHGSARSIEGVGTILAEKQSHRETR
jgi:hypothetical protein